MNAEKNTAKTKKTKTRAKAMGLKSVLTFDGKVVVTSFAQTAVKDGKVDTACKKSKAPHIEKVTTKDGEIISSSQKMFRSDVTASDITLSKRDVITQQNVSSSFVNPAAGKAIGTDYIGIKDIVEQEFFGAKFPNDNLRVQIAYNILDIKKILNAFVNNIVYAFRNLNRDGIGNFGKDIIGTECVSYSLADQRKAVNESSASSSVPEIKVIKETLDQTEMFIRNTQAYYVFFGDVFSPTVKRGKDNKPYYLEGEELTAVENRNFNVIRLLSLVRQLTMHAQNNFGDKNAQTVYTESALFNLDYNHSGYGDLLKLLDEVYQAGVDQVNREFDANAKNNLYILSKVFDIQPRGYVKLAEDYYDYVVRKENQNVGINLKRLREVIIDTYYSFVKDKTHDPFRGKINTVLGYILYRTAVQNGVTLADMVEKLRANVDGEEGKEKIYAEYAQKYWTLVKGKFKSAMRIFQDEGGIGNRRKFASTIKYPRISNKITADNTDVFVKLLYFVTKFLDGKEINELLCSMLNKFENIHDLLQTAKVCGETISFKPEYKIFERADEIAGNIRMTKNIGRMKPELKEVGITVMLDALAMLGKKIEKYKKRAVNDGNGVTYIAVKNADNEYVTTAEYDSFIKEYIERPKKDHKLRNFIVNNVLESKWFFYVARYVKPEDCRKLMANKNIVRFALNEIPDAQILRYYKAVKGNDGVSDYAAMRAELVHRLNAYSAVDLTNATVGEETEKHKAIVRLYLTVAYLITKSIVKVNSRFAIAFSTLERDSYLLSREHGCIKPITDKTGKNSDYLAVTQMFIDRDKVIYDDYAARLAQIKTLDITKEERKALLSENGKKLKLMHYTPKWYNIISKTLSEANWNDSNSRNQVYKGFRNNVVHLNSVDVMSTYFDSATKITSYYDFYCFVEQSILAKNNTVLGAYAEKLNKYGSHINDLMWLINLPFAYNLARYKNLSIQNLFYSGDNIE